MSITSCGDYANIYDYAITPFRWAVSNGIVYPDSSSNKRLYPKAGVYRKELALWICRFDTNVEGIRLSKDTYSFINQSSYFASPNAVDNSTGKVPRKYLISSSNYNKLLSLANSSEKSAIAEYVSGISWGGACYGMSMSMMLDKYGVIDINGNYANSCNTIYSMPKPSAVSDSHHKTVWNRTGQIKFTALEDTINYYHLSQFVKSKINISDTGGRFDNKTSASGTPAKGLVDSLQKGGIVMVNYTVHNAFTDTNSAHSVLLYGKPVLNSGYYDIKCWDPNVGNSTAATLRVKQNYENCYFVLPTGNVFPNNVLYYSSYYGLLSFDIDGANNGRAKSAVKNEDTTWIYVDANADCTITNADGETIRSEYGVVSGNMEILDTRMIVLGDELPARMAWKVKASEEFIFNTESECSGFYAEIDDELYGVSGTGITNMTISKNRVQINGNTINYKVISTASMEEDHYIRYYGSCYGELELAFDGVAPLTAVNENQHAEIVDVWDLSTEPIA